MNKESIYKYTELLLGVAAIAISLRACAQSDKALRQSASEMRPRITISPRLSTVTTNMYFQAKMGTDGLIRFSICFDIENTGNSTAIDVSSTTNSIIIFRNIAQTNEFIVPIGDSIDISLAPGEAWQFMHGGSFKPLGSTNLEYFVDQFRNGDATFEAKLVLEYRDEINPNVKYVRRSHFVYDKDFLKLVEYRDD